MNHKTETHFLLKGWTGLTRCIAPLLPFYLHNRCKKGKEIQERLPERKGYATLPPFPQKPIQFHAASVGELISILPLIRKIHQCQPEQYFLVTTGTVTSFHVFQHYINENKQLESFVIHQFIPLDVPAWTTRFLTYWNPSLIVLVESELWPNFIQTATQNRIPLTLINARLSDRSTKNWLYFPKPIQILLSKFKWITTQSIPDQKNFLKLGVNTFYLGNLKQNAPKLSYDENEFHLLKAYFKDKPIFLAASTHETEESCITRIHEKLRQTHPDLMTIIVPRHPERGTMIIHEIGSVARRSLKEMPFENGIWLCDTLGELGLFYRLASIVFMGNSLKTTPKGGGHNPFEPAMLECAISTGPKIHNFTQAYEFLKNSIPILHTEHELFLWVNNMLNFPEKRKKLADQTLQTVQEKNELINITTQNLLKLRNEKQ